jgi:AAA+ superfamily predicted ATPase
MPTDESLLINDKNDKPLFKLNTANLSSVYAAMQEAHESYDIMDKEATEFLKTDRQESTLREISEFEYEVKVESLWRYLRLNYTISRITNFDLHRSSETTPVYHDFKHRGKPHKIPYKMTAFLTEKQGDNRLVVSFLPFDGKNLDVRFMFDATEIKSEELWNDIDNFFYTEGLLKGERFTAKYDFLEMEEYNWDSIIASDANRKLMQRNVVDFINHTQVYAEHGVKTSRGLIVCGPPGTGKTLSCKVVMNQVDATCIYVARDSVEDIGDIGRIYKLARKLAPTLVIIEDIDTLGGITRLDADHPLLGEFLNALDGVEANEGVITIATTNYSNKLDWAIADRPGRFDIRIDLGYPDADIRRGIIQQYLESFTTDKINIDSLVKNTDGLSGAYLQEIVRLAFMKALELVEYDPTKAIIKNDYLVAACGGVLKQREKTKNELAIYNDDATDDASIYG